MVLLLACTAGMVEPDWDDTGDTHVEADADADSDADSDTDADSDSDADTDVSDAQKAWDLIEGRRTDRRTVLLEVGLSGGWPIETDDGYLFMAVDAGSDVALAGDHNAWALDPMTDAGAVWWAVRDVSAPQGSGYKFVVDDSDYSADPWARAFTWDHNGELSYVRGAGGHVERWINVPGSGVLPHTIDVWVPTGVPTHHLYAQDGQNLFDPGAIWGGWGLQHVVSDSTLVVGVHNGGADRLDEYGPVTDVIEGTTYGGQGDAYASYLLETVRPLVEGAYGVPSKRGVMGSSMGGLISLHVVLTQPTEWDYAASLSGTLGWGSIGANNPTVIDGFDDAGFIGVPIYVDSGGDAGSGCVDSDGDGIYDDSPDASDNFCENRQFADLLAAEGWTWDTDLWHWHEPGAPHNEAAWADRVERPVQLFEGL